MMSNTSLGVPDAESKVLLTIIEARYKSKKQESENKLKQENFRVVPRSLEGEPQEACAVTSMEINRTNR